MNEEIITEKRMDKEEVRRLVREEGLMLTDLIDVVIEENGMIGVGLITFGENVQKYIEGKIKPPTLEQFMSD